MAEAKTATITIREDGCEPNASDTVDCNSERAVQAYCEVEEDEEFVVEALGSEETKVLCRTVPYCAKWVACSGLHLAKQHLIRRTFAHKRELGLFTLFLNTSYLDCIRAWTSKELVERGKRAKALRMDELLAYIGLELATSVHKLNRLQDYWSNSDLLGIPFFKKVMSRDTFMNIRSALRTYATYDPNIAVVDPLWHSRTLLEHFARNAASLAVPLGVSSLDENTIRCKGRTAARSYIKSKPVKFGIRFYAVVGWCHAYLHSLQDNGSGNKSTQTPVQRYTHLFRNLRGAVERKMDGTLVPKTTASALWCAQMAHQTQLYPSKEAGRLMVMDNFYTRHVLARQLESLSDKECKVLGTVRFTNVDGINRPALREAVEALRHASRGEWRLVQIFEKGEGRNAPRKVATKTRFVVFKDRTVVTFYTNDLADTPSSLIHNADDHAIACVHGLAPLERWTGDESLRRTTFHVPAIIVAYNLFMNGVDRFDQFRSRSAPVRKEQRVTMSLLTFVLYASIINSHALLHAISKPGEAIPDALLLKRRVIHQLVMDHVEYNQTRASILPLSAADKYVSHRYFDGSFPATKHLLLETEGRKSVRCMLCSLLSNQGVCRGYTMYSCTVCRRGFHVSCFTIYHNEESIRYIRPEVYHAVMSAKASLSSKYHRNSHNKVTASLGTAKLLRKK